MSRSYQIPYQGGGSFAVAMRAAAVAWLSERIRELPQGLGSPTAVRTALEASTGRDRESLRRICRGLGLYVMSVYLGRD